MKHIFHHHVLSCLHSGAEKLQQIGFRVQTHSFSYNPSTLSSRHSYLRSFKMACRHDFYGTGRRTWQRGDQESGREWTRYTCSNACLEIMFSKLKSPGNSLSCSVRWIFICVVRVWWECVNKFMILGSFVLYLLACDFLHLAVLGSLLLFHFDYTTSVNNDGAEKLVLHEQISDLDLNWKVCCPINPDHRQPYLLTSCVRSLGGWKTWGMQQHRGSLSHHQFVFWL